MFSSLPQLSEGTIIPVLAIACVFGTLVITTLAYHIRLYACHRQEINLKRELVERGLSVEEIERVVAAGKSADEVRRSCVRS
jgi:hypothetical protein